jgi:hypothetical protein
MLTLEDLEGDVGAEIVLSFCCGIIGGSVVTLEMTSFAVSVYSEDGAPSASRSCGIIYC